MENPTVNYKQIIAEVNSRMFNVRDEYKNNDLEQNKFICHLDRRPFSVGVINVTGDLNVGMMIRTASLLGASNFYIFGRRKFDARSTVGAENYINIVQSVYDDPLNADQQILDDLRRLPHPIFVCEHGGAELGSDDCKSLFMSVDGLHPLFLFGSESHGVPQLILDQMDKTGYPTYEFERISIPQRGVLRSYNVSAAMAMVCWDYCREVFYDRD